MNEALATLASMIAKLIAERRLFVHYQPIVDPDVVKLDRELVQGIAEDRNRRSLFGAIACYCRQTSKVMVAEGLESWLDLAAAVRAGAGLGQGFLLGRPGPVPAPLEPEIEAELRGKDCCDVRQPVVALHRA